MDEGFNFYLLLLELGFLLMMASSDMRKQYSLSKILFQRMYKLEINYGKLYSRENHKWEKGQCFCFVYPSRGVDENILVADFYNLFQL